MKDNSQSVMLIGWIFIILLSSSCNEVFPWARDLTDRRAMELFNKQQYREALVLFKRAAAGGQADAMNQIGWIRKPRVYV
jgi:hypothetical protein